MQRRSLDTIPTLPETLFNGNNSTYFHARIRITFNLVVSSVQPIAKICKGDGLDAGRRSGVPCSKLVIMVTELNQAVVLGVRNRFFKPRRHEARFGAKPPVDHD